MTPRMTLTSHGSQITEIAKAQPQITEAVETMIKKGKWSVPGYRVSSTTISREWTLTRLLHATGEVRRVLSHVNGWRSIRMTVLDVGSESLRAIKGNQRLYRLRGGLSRTQSDEMKTCKTKHFRPNMPVASFASSPLRAKKSPENYPVSGIMLYLLQPDVQHLDTSIL